MTLLSRLFKNKTSTPPATAKKQQELAVQHNVAQLEQLPIDELVEIAVSGREHAVRIAAIAKLAYGDALKSLAFDHITPKIQVPARQRIAALLDQSELDFNTLNSDVDDKVTLLAVVGFCQQLQLQDQVLNSSDDEQFLYRVAIEGASARIRQQAAGRITNRDRLEKLLKQSKGRDKTIYRMAKDKCDAFKEQDKHQQQITANVDALCTALERHSKRAFDPMFHANLNHMKEQWTALQHDIGDHANNDNGSACSENNQSNSKNIGISVQQRQRIANALSACQAIADEQARIHAEQEQHKQAIANASAQRQTVLDQLRELIAQLYSAQSAEDEQQTALTATLTELQQQWQTSLQYVAANEQQLTLFQRLKDAIDNELHQLAKGTLQQQLESAIAASDNLEPNTLKALRERLKATRLLHDNQLPEPVTNAQQFINEYDQKRQQEKDSVQQFNRQIGGLIRRATEAIDRGQVRQASGIRRSIEQKMASQTKTSTNLTEQLERLDEKLAQLQDWRSYAVQPKMQELVQQMQALVDASINPELLAEKIKQLQEQWRVLSVGGGGQYQDLWEQFHQLAQVAYEPCKAHFQQQSDIRQQNLQKRKNLVTQLGDFFTDYDWDNADWKLVEKMLKVARQEWREYSPTERAASKEVQAQFDKQLADVQQHLDREYQKNAQHKQHLIEQAQQLAESDSEDSRANADAVKALQAKWKTVGVISRKVDQALWKEFRTHCDRVFNKRQQQSEQFKAQLSESLQQAQTLCTEIEALSQLTGKDLLAARTQLGQLQTAFKALGTLPKNEANTTKARYAAAVDQFEAAVANQRKQAKEKLWTDLLNANAAINTYHLAVFNANNIETAKDRAQTAIEADTQWPKGGKEALTQKMAAATATNQQDFSTNEAALRRLCIRMEILADIESPASDQAMRMSYQVERLQQGLGQATNSTDATMTTLIFEWIAAAPVPDDIYQPLQQRFSNARTKIVPK